MHHMTFGQKVQYFLALRTAATGQRFDTLFMPENISEAYKIQKAVTAELGCEVVGWKLGGTNQATRDLFQCNVAYLGPLLTISPSSPAFSSSTEVRGEVEISFRLSSAVSAISLQGVSTNPLQYFDRAYLSVELPFTRITNLEEVGLLPLIADLCGTGHLVLGPAEIVYAPARLNNRDIAIGAEGKCLATGNTNNLVTSYARTLADFLTIALENQISLRSGQIVATGGLTDCILLPNESVVRVSISGFDDFSFSI